MYSGKHSLREAAGKVISLTLLIKAKRLEMKKGHQTKPLFTVDIR
jgi:hypothetical protein